MDLTIQVDGGILNLRVVVILETEHGYMLEHHRNGYYFFPGGRIKSSESSLEAAKRESFEETGLTIENFEFLCVVENFYTQEVQVQEICFVYKTGKIDATKINSQLSLKEFTVEKMKTMDIKPVLIRDLILGGKLKDKAGYIIK